MVRCRPWRYRSTPRYWRGRHSHRACCIWSRANCGYSPPRQPRGHPCPCPRRHRRPSSHHSKIHRQRRSPNRCQNRTPSEPPGLPACCVSCSFCCSALLMTEATLLLESFVITLVLVSTMVLPFASVISLDSCSPSSAGSTPNTVRRPRSPCISGCRSQVALGLAPYMQLACSMRLHHGRHRHAIGRNAGNNEHQRARQQHVRPRRQAQPASHAHRGATLCLSAPGPHALSSNKKHAAQKRRIHSYPYVSVSANLKGCATNEQIRSTNAPIHAISESRTGLLHNKQANACLIMSTPCGRTAGHAAEHPATKSFDGPR